MKQIVVACAAVAILPVLAPVPAAAQEPGSYTRESCWRAVSHEARGQFAARNIGQISSNLRTVSPAENVLEGRGVADGRPFGYSCTYNFKSHQTYGVEVRAEGRPPPPPPPSLPGGSWAETCTNPEMRGPILFAQCRMAGGGWNSTRLDMRACRSGRATNLNGALVCG
jgi:hypothetical protein